MSAASKLILWESIKDACESGCRTFDFGRVSNNDPGLIQFKAYWGGERKSLYHSYLPAPAMTLGNTRDGALFRIAVQAVRLMPVSFYSALSERYFGSFG
jgi:hypothetical protein